MKEIPVGNSDAQSDEIDATILPVTFTPADSPATRSFFLPSRRRIFIGGLLLICALALTFLLVSRSLIFETVPINADVRVSGLALPLGDSHLVLPGEYKYTIRATGYRPASGKVAITGNKNARHTVKLERLPGHLQIVSDPRVAIKVLVDGIELANDQGLVKHIPPGNRQITVLTERHLPVNEKIEIEGLDNTQTLPITLRPAWASVHINSEPSGASVALADKTLGTTPLTAELLQGEKHITLSLPGHKTRSIPVTVTAGVEQTLATVVLPAADGVLQLSSTPSAASVTVNGAYRGHTPIELALAPDSTHQLRLFKDGYSTETEKITLRSGEEHAVAMTLTPVFGKILVTSIPADAEIYIDGKLAAAGKNSFTLPARSHAVRIRKAGYADYQTKVMPNGKFEQKIHAVLLTEAQARWSKIPRQIKHGAGGRMKLMRPNAQFSMGSSRREQGRRANEAIRQVSLTRPFYIGITEVTNREYRQFKPDHSSSHTQGISLDNNNLPAVNLSWNDAALFCNWLSARDGLEPVYRQERESVIGFNAQADGYRLLTEAEWTWAARYENGNMRKFPWGDLLPIAANSGNYADTSAAQIVPSVLRDYSDRYPATAPVASFAANHAGIFDLGGNVSEWIHDLYSIGTGLSSKLEENPVGPQKGDYHVIRGSSWKDAGLTELRLSYRDYGAEGRDNTGFRLARWVNINNRGDSK